MSESAAHPHPVDPVAPDANEQVLARESSHRLTPFQQQDLCIRLADTDETTVLPAGAVKLLVAALSEMADGNAVVVTSVRSELSTQQAAELLGVSRPFLIKLLEEGKMPFRKVGTHRRVLLGDLLEYKRRIDEKRLDVLDKLAAQAQELD